MEHDILYLKIELSQKWQKYDLVRFYSKRLIYSVNISRNNINQFVVYVSINTQSTLVTTLTPLNVRGPLLLYSGTVAKGKHCTIFEPHLCLMAPQGVILSEFREDLDTQNQNEWAIMWWRKHDNMFSRFDTIPVCDGQTDGRTNVQPISTMCFSMADTCKNLSVLIEVYQL